MAYRSSNKSAALGGATVSVNLPAGIQSGDILLMAISADSSGWSFAATGWTQIDSQTGGPDNQQFWLARRTADGSEGATVSVTTGGVIRANALTVALSGRNTDTPVTFSTYSENNSSNTSPISISATGGTATTGDDLAFFVTIDQQAADDNWDCSTPTNFTARESDVTTGWTSSALFTRDNVSSGATGAIATTATRSSGSGNAGWLAYVVAVAAGEAVTAKPALMNSMLRRRRQG